MKSYALVVLSLLTLAACAQQEIAAPIGNALEGLCQNNSEHCTVLPPEPGSPFGSVVYK